MAPEDRVFFEDTRLLVQSERRKLWLVFWMALALTVLSAAMLLVAVILVVAS